MSEEMNKTDLKDEDLKKVTGGGKPKICTPGMRSSSYATCPNSSLKGQFQQCATCSLK